VDFRETDYKVARINLELCPQSLWFLLPDILCQ